MIARQVHPAAWWLWALCLGYAAMRTTNPLLLVSIAGVAGLVVAARRGTAPWARAYGLLLRLGLLTVLITMLLQMIIGVRVPGHVLFRLPSADLPHWLAGLSLGGPVTAEAVLNSFTAGLRLAVLVACFGAANALAHPARLVRVLPAALYEVGVAIVVAMTFVPKLAESLERVRAAQRLRGRPITGLRGLRGLIVPVLQEALEGAISLAASMDSRGYGRRAEVPRVARRVSAAALLIGLIGAAVGTYQVIGAGGRLEGRVGIVLLSAGTAAALFGGLLAGRRGRRSRYRPDPWRAPEWLVLACGAAVVLAYQLGVPRASAAGVALAWPDLPVLPFLVTVLAALPAVATPPVPGAAAAVHGTRVRPAVSVP